MLKAWKLSAVILCDRHRLARRWAGRIRSDLERRHTGWSTTQVAATTPDPTYVLPPFPGLWQPTPPANSFATFTFYPTCFHSRC